MDGRPLDRRCITGPLDRYTPTCVLLEIAAAHGIEYDPEEVDHTELRRIIKQTERHAVSNPPVLADYTYIARYLNPACSWTVRTLLQAYNFFQQFQAWDPLSLVPCDYTIGNQTPERPHSLNLCVLYKICQSKGLRLTSNTQPEQLSAAVSLLREEPGHLVGHIRHFVDKQLRLGIRISDMINILLMSTEPLIDNEPTREVTNYQSLPVEKVNYDILTQLYRSLHDQEWLRSLINPSTVSGSIALAATRYQLDISRSSTPMEEYSLLRTVGRKDYVPVDPWLKYWYKKSPHLFDITVTFNPLFPVSYYQEETLLSMATIEGYSAVELRTNSPYELLQLARLTDTFYLGEVPGMKQTQTIISLDEVTDLPMGELFCFGRQDTTFLPVSVDELIDGFTENQSFRNILEADSMFPTQSISKLKMLLQPRGFPEEVQNKRNQLLRLIVSLETLLGESDEVTREFYNTYRNSSARTKTQIRNLLVDLLHSGMFMRAWTGEGPYPIEVALCTDEFEPQQAVNVTDAIATYVANAATLGPIGLLVNRLPLYSQREGTYEKSVHRHDGFTIGERIEIVKKGKNTSNTASCIRMTSNYLCTSAHKYMRLLGMPEPFPLYKLARIA